jgi:hypothetical protein
VHGMMNVAMAPGAISHACPRRGAQPRGRRATPPVPPIPPPGRGVVVGGRQGRTDNRYYTANARGCAWIASQSLTVNAASVHHVCAPAARARDDSSEQRRHAAPAPLQGPKPVRALARLRAIGAAQPAAACWAHRVRWMGLCAARARGHVFRDCVRRSVPAGKIDVEKIEKSATTPPSKSPEASKETPACCTIM